MVKEYNLENLFKNPLCGDKGQRNVYKVLKEKWWPLYLAMSPPAWSPLTPLLTRVWALCDEHTQSVTECRHLRKVLLQVALGVLLR